jgi:Cu-processing system permease protein
MTVPDRVSELEQAVRSGDAEAVSRRADGVRDEIETALTGKQLTSGSLVIERKRRLHHRLEVLEDKAQAGAWEKANEDLDTVVSLARQVADDVDALPEAQRRKPVRGPAWLQNTLTVARKELVVLLKSTEGLLLAGLFLVTFGIGLEAALGDSVAGEASVKLVWNYAHSLDFLAVPLAGILVGHGLVNEEITSNTIHVLASKPVSRLGIVLGKFLGMAGALGGIVLGSGTLVGSAAYAATGQLGGIYPAVGYVVAVYLLALAFGSMSLAVSTLLDRRGAALVASIGGFVVIGPVWQNAFLRGSLETAGQLPDVTSVLVYLASPFTAWWNWTSELLGPTSAASGLPQGEPWHAALVSAVEQGTLDGLPFYAQQWFYALVLVAWVAIGLAGAAVVFERRDLG